MMTVDLGVCHKEKQLLRLNNWWILSRKKDEKDTDLEIFCRLKNFHQIKLYVDQSKGKL